MKINAKLFVLAFTIITLVSVSSAFIYNKLAQQLIHDQQSKVIVNSANDFIFAFQQLIQKVDDSFQHNGKNQLLNSKGLDFLFEINTDSTIVKSSIKIRDNVFIYSDVSRLSEFLEYNSNLIVRHFNDGKCDVYYGIQINSEILKDLSEQIRADVALVESDVISKFTNSDEYNYYLPSLSTTAREFKNKNNFEIIHKDLGNVELTATHFSPKISDVSNKQIDFIIFNISGEAADFTATMSLVSLVIVISGILLTIVFLFLFTTKFRKQLDFISEGVSEITSGDSSKRVKIISRDEIGALGNAFNKMLDELDKRDLEEKEYAELISIINENPSLEDIGHAALQKIISSTGADIGAFYLHNNGEYNPFAIVGLIDSKKEMFVESGFYNKAKKQRKIIELNFTENNPVVKTGLTEFNINHLYILPIFYNNELLAVMELASINKPKVDIKEYLDKIKAQLAIGLANGKALSELKNMVDKLQNLNSAYQKQNIEITEKNEELVQLHDELKKGSKELEIQTAKAVESEKVKSQFLANMSHELRTPQNSILGLTELILKDETTPVQTREKLNVVLRNGKKLLTLIENILEYSKLESGNTELRESTIYLNELMDEVYSFIYPLFIETNIDFKIHVPQDYNYEISSDVKKIEQIIYNLIGNAIKFTKDGFVKLSLEVLENNLEIIVEDTGPGISDEDQKIIFEEFRQADGNLNRKFSGSGLGLAICKRYTELLNGEIFLQSNLGKGSIFKVSLPGIVKSRTSIQKESSALTKQVKKISALIVSDGYDSIKLISDYLLTNNIDVDVINSEEIEIKNIKEAAPDIIIIDILFNERNGWNFLTNIKMDSSLKSIPVVIINMDEEANCGLGLKVFEFCTENFTRDSIDNSIALIESVKGENISNLHIISSEEKFTKILNEMNDAYLNLSSTTSIAANLNQIINFEPDAILIDILDNNINSLELLTEINNNRVTKDIPVIAFIHEINEEEKTYVNNSFFETTLIKQFHPLDVLKVIKDRIELFDKNAFVLSENNSVKENEWKEDSVKNNQIFDSKIKVLIVDDDSDARFTIGEIIKSLNYEPIFATNGYECLEKLNDEWPNLILLDIMMPKMDGFQTIKKIRENEKFKELNVYALTAYAMLSDKEIIEKNGFDGLFTKPINTVQLERKLTNIFKTAI